MTSIHLDTSNDKYLISIDKQAINKTWLVKLVEKLRKEELAKKFDFDEEIEEIGEQIKADWWKNNKHRFINE
ncbi:MAG: hypothetical protein ACK4NY_14730 [Spirosomataceae bacterium]